MSGPFNGVHAIIRKEYAPRALYVHCAAHSLNLAISKASTVPSIRNFLGVIENVYNFFNTPKRSAKLEEILDSSEESPDIKKLKRLNLTRWISKYEAVNDFFALLEFIFHALEEIETDGENYDCDTSTAAKMCRKAMDFEFVVSLFVVRLIYENTLPLCRSLQRKNIDLIEAVGLADDVSKQIAGKVLYYTLYAFEFLCMRKVIGYPCTLDQLMSQPGYFMEP